MSDQVGTASCHEGALRAFPAEAKPGAAIASLDFFPHKNKDKQIILRVTRVVGCSVKKKRDKFRVDKDLGIFDRLKRPFPLDLLLERLPMIETQL